MAVVRNFWLRDNKQKLGGAVIYQAKGQTLMRQLAPSISNPRTDAQMETRVKLSNLVAFYRASSKWMKGAFETKHVNQSDYNAFVSANAAVNAVWLTKTQVEAGVCVVAPYTVSRGSLGEIRQTQTTNKIVSNLYVGDLTINSATTIAQLSAALIANNNGMSDGDQLSLIQYIQNTNTGGSYSVVCRAYEVILDTSNNTLLSEYLPVELLDVSTDETPALAVKTTSFVGGVAFVMSRTNGGKILVSTSTVTITYNNAVYAAMTATSQKNTAIRSYGSNTTVFLDSNMATDVNGSIATAFSILNISINGVVYNVGDDLPESINESSQITINLSAAIENPTSVRAAFSNAAGEVMVGLTNTTPTTAAAVSALTFTPEETAEFTESNYYRLGLYDDDEYQNMTIYADFGAHNSNGEGLG